MTVLFERHDMGKMKEISAEIEQMDLMREGLNMKIFPTFSSHDEVQCFHCDADLVSNPIADTDYGRDGGWRKHCESCKMFTWYDVKEQIDGTR